VIAASDEVVIHHIAEHRRRCPLVDWRVRPCPCESAVALICATCWQPVLLALDPLCPPCAHALELLAP
jgi:hypothetical protein